MIFSSISWRKICRLLDPKGHLGTTWIGSPGVFVNSIPIVKAIPGTRFVCGKCMICGALHIAFFGSRYLYKFMSYYLKVMMIYEVMLYTIQYYQYLCNEYIFINKYNEVSQKHIWWAWYLQDAWNLEPWHHPSSTTSRVRVPSLINNTSSMALVLFPGMFTGMDAS